MTATLRAPRHAAPQVTGLRHALSVDVEDWPQSSFDYDLPVTERSARNTYAMLDLFAEHNVRGTFFILGLFGEKFPDVVREIADAGHEVASHGYSHRPVFTLTPQTFRDELNRSVKQLEDITGDRVRGYRAPDFSITDRSLWALDLIAEAGLDYDSSVMPIRMPRYGIEGFEPSIHRLDNGLVEVPMSTARVFGRAMPVAGGGYLRLLPAAMTERIIAGKQAANRPAIVYLHPYELDPGEFRSLSFRVPLKTRLTQGIGRRHIAGRLGRLFRRFEFAPIVDIVDHAAGEWQNT